MNLRRASKQFTFPIFFWWVGVDYTQAKLSMKLQKYVPKDEENRLYSRMIGSVLPSLVRTQSLSLIKMNIESVCCVLMFINVIDRSFCEKLASVDDYVSG